MPSSVGPSTSYGAHTRRLVRRTLIAVGLALAVMVALMRLQTYRTSVAQAERLTLVSLRYAAATAARAIDGDAHQRLERRFSRKDAVKAVGDDTDYDVVHRQLQRVHTELDLQSPVYTYVPCSAGKASTHEFLVTSSIEPYFRHSFTSLAESQQRDFGTAGVLGIYEDDFGSWLSAFAPVHNSAGEVVAMVQVDEPFDAFIAAARAEASRGWQWTVLLFVFILGGLGKFLYNMLHREREDKEALAEAVSRQTLLTEQLAEREAELQRNAVQLETSNRDLTDFANIASHDLKSPLRGIASFAQLLARRNRATLDESSNEYLEFILSNSQRALKLVDGLLAYAKTGEASAEQVDFELAAAAADAVENLRSTLEDSGGTVTVGNLPAAHGDRTLLTQVFQNLIGNGVKYNRESEPNVHVDSYLEPDGARVFRVRDNGIGIPAEHQAQVFDMFRRLHTGDEFEGSGIGLAFCVRIVGRYGGTMWLESEEGKGSTFYFTLPDAVGQVEQMELV